MAAAVRAGTSMLPPRVAWQRLAHMQRTQVDRAIDPRLSVLAARLRGAGERPFRRCLLRMMSMVSAGVEDVRRRLPILTQVCLQAGFADLLDKAPDVGL